MQLKQRLGAGVKAFMHPSRPVVRPFAAQPERLVTDKLLAGTSALITGAARNIGRGIALEMAAHGADVYCTDIDAEGCSLLAAELAQLAIKSRVFLSDIGKSSDADSLCVALRNEGIEINALVNNVGIAASDMQQVLQTNVIGPAYLTEAISKRMIERGLPGSILFVSSIHQQTVHRWSAAYSASKGALGMLIKELALDLARHQIRVNGIAPGAVEEDQHGGTVPSPFTPLRGSSISPAYIGRAAVYLTAEYFSRHTTGSVVTIDGGLSLFNYMSAIEAGLKL
jgi:NAD(P)-dependent dehydrogenase (short-subunit alcohol dehydrogenase family)